MSISTRQASIQQLADIVSAEIQGDPEVIISGIATLELAESTELSFFTNRKYHSYLKTTRAAVVILHPDDVEECPTNAIVSTDPYLAYARIATWLTRPDEQQGQIAADAVIADNVSLGENVSIGAHTVIEDGARIGADVVIHPGCVIAQRVKIGAGSVLYANSSIYADVSIGKHCIIHSGAVIGSDGFGIANEKGQWFKVPQLGRVIIGNHVEIGANTTIDRGAIEDTVIENGVKLDNLIQIAHNVHIGENTAIAGCVGIAGSSTIGKHCAIGGGSGILGHLTIADHVHITATSLVTKSIKHPGVYSSGTPLQENSQWHKNFVRFKQLDKMARRITELEKIVK